MNKTQRILVGHGAYRGRNSLAVHQGHSQALADLLRRGIRMADAQRALRNAKAGSHATCSYYSKAPSGRWIAVDTVEVIAIYMDEQIKQGQA